MNNLHKCWGVIHINVGLNKKKCRYISCDKGGIINIEKEPYEKSGRMYFHKECFFKKIKADEWSQKSKSFSDEFKKIWIENINKRVSINELSTVVNSLIENGNDYDYLLFVLKYCVQNKLNLNYPYGFVYFVNKNEIREEYTRDKFKKTINKDAFKIDVSNQKETFFKFKNKGTSKFQDIISNKSNGSED